MSDLEQFAAVIIGAGQAAMPLAGELAEAGWRTAVVERRSVGGTCINDGCTPTKTMIASARIAHLARQAPAYGVLTEGVRVSVPRVRQRKQAVVESFRQGSRRRLEGAENIDLIEGEARFIGPRSLLVKLKSGGERRLTADTIVLDTGARPRRPDLPGLEDIQPLTSTSIMELDILPDHLLVMGGGYVGLEFGQMFRRFGSEVTIIQRRDQLLTREDRDVAEALAKILEDEGIDLLFESEAQEVNKSPEGGLELRLETKGGANVVSGSHLLLAVGREPNTDRLGLDREGIDLELDARGHIRVDDRLRTSVDGVYAVGDVKGGPAFTHISYDDYRILAANLLRDEDRSIEGRLVPYTVYTDPQLGRVGLTEKEARERDLPIKVAKIPMDYSSRAIEAGDTRGLMKAVVDAETDQILGCAVLGLEGGELMSALQLAMMGGLTASELRESVFAHPTLAESFNTLFANYKS